MRSCCRSTSSVNTLTIGRTQPGNTVDISEAWVAARLDAALPGGAREADRAFLLAEGFHSPAPATKTGLVKQTDEAVQHGAFGVPVMLIDGEFFFGSTPVIPTT